MKKNPIPLLVERLYIVRTVLANGGVLISRPFPSLSAALTWAQFAERHGVDVTEVTVQIRQGEADQPA